MDLSRQEFLLKDLPTKSVTLYPSRAHIIRVIENVNLKPGQNEIEIYGLTPTVDEHSIQVYGTGVATITDFTVELVPNREIFEEVFPADDQDDGSSSDDEDVIEVEDCDEVKKLIADIEKLEADIASHKEIVNSSARQLDTLDTYSKTLKADKNGADDVVKTIAMYEQERAKIFSVHCEAAESLKRANKAIEETRKEKEKAGIADRKRYAERVRAKEKKDRQQRLQRDKRREEARRIKEENLKFWPKKVYAVTVNLETPLDTPASSRRGSVDSVTLAQSYSKDAHSKGADSVTGDGKNISLLISYVTRDAAWTPRYDISLNSINKTAAIVYRAELINGTSEIWKDTQIILSTSQTSYSGLEDKVPFLHPWHVKLNRSYDQGLLSPEEINHPRTGAQGATATAPTRNELFGSSEAFFTWGSKNQQQQQVKAHQPQVQQAQGYLSSHSAPVRAMKSSAPVAAAFGASNNCNSPFSQRNAPQNITGGLFGQAAPSRNAMNNVSEFGSPSSLSTNARDSANAGLFANANTVAEGFSSMNQARMAPRARKSGFSLARKEAAPASHASEREESDEDMGYGLFDDGVDGDPSGQLGYQESQWDDHGLTSTYDVPGTRTLAPSSLARRHRIASLNATKVHLSHIAVAKLRPAAFLRAKVRNPSTSVTLLKGTAGITLDGSFIGNTLLNRVAPGSVFDLPLGVDPSVQISYPKPTVHRSTAGLFSKETAQVFSRNIWITNSKIMPIELLVLDQIPISEDDRLTVGILQPRGLGKEGDVVRAGSAAKEGSSGAQQESAAKTSAWGKATATLKKDGQIAWTVNMEKKQACLLKLEYETRMPAAERIMPA